ncbi:sensor histidine kinase [Lachnospiraceae bacterium KM106-2]|nr:sensor histidine kinase [Lachnospiraceae bacterium KM106-2]
MSERIQDQCMLFTAAIVIAASSRVVDQTLVVTWLVALTVDALLLVTTKVHAKLTLMILYILACVVQPEFFIWLPVILYWAFEIDGVPIYIMTGMAVIISYENITQNLTTQKLVIYLPLLCLSYLLEQRTTKVLQLEEAYKKLRDTSVEYNEALKQRNRELLAKQDNEIYVATLLERNRIAREIHDNVGHMLTGSILLLGALLAVNQDDKMKEGLSNLKANLDHAMNGMRESVHDLHDESIDLKMAVLKIIEEFTFCEINLDYDMSKEVPKEIKYSMIAIVKEALVNVAKHSNATKVHIIMREHPGIFQLLIQDNGTKEFHVSGDGMGTTNMKERIEKLRGTISIERDQGYRIFVSIPK